MCMNLGRERCEHQYDQLKTLIIYLIEDVEIGRVSEVSFKSIAIFMGFDVVNNADKADLDLINM